VKDRVIRLAIMIAGADVWCQYWHMVCIRPWLNNNYFIPDQLTCVYSTVRPWEIVVEKKKNLLFCGSITLRTKHNGTPFNWILSRNHTKNSIERPFVFCGCHINCYEVV